MNVNLDIDPNDPPEIRALVGKAITALAEADVAAENLFKERQQQWLRVTAGELLCILKERGESGKVLALFDWDKGLFGRYATMCAE